MGEWSESTYTETRFGGMDASHEPHTLDRDTGLMADVFNMLARTQGLVTRPGYVMVYDLSMVYSPAPSTQKAVVGLLPYFDNLEVETSQEDGPEEESGSQVIPSVIDPTKEETGTGVHPGGKKPEKEEEEEDELPQNPGAFSMTVPGLVICDVPFQMSISRTGSGEYSGDGVSLTGRHGEATANIATNPKTTTGWSGRGWTGSVRVYTRSRAYDGVTFRVSLPKANGATATASYAVGHMVPEMPESITPRTNFDWEVRYTYNGTLQTGYAGNGAGLAVRLTCIDSEGNQVEGARVSEVGERSISNGVIRGHGIVALGADAVAVRLEATFAGETLHADADLVQGVGQLNIVGPQRLHVWGDWSELEIHIL